MALHPSDDLTYDVSSDRMTFAVLVGGDGVLHELPDAANGAPASAERGMCREAAPSTRAGFIHSEQRRSTNGWAGRTFAYAVFPAKSRHTCTALGITWSPPVSEQSRWRKFSAPFGVESAMRAQPRSAEKIVPAAREKLSACFWRAEDAHSIRALFCAHRPARFPPDSADAAVGTSSSCYSRFTRCKGHIC